METFAFEELVHQPDFRGVPISKNFMHLKRERHCPRSLATTFSRQVLSIKVGFHEPAVQVSTLISVTVFIEKRVQPRKKDLQLSSRDTKNVKSSTRRCEVTGMVQRRGEWFSAVESRPTLCIRALCFFRRDCAVRCHCGWLAVSGQTR